MGDISVKDTTKKGHVLHLIAFTFKESMHLKNVSFNLPGDPPSFGPVVLPPEACPGLTNGTGNGFFHQCQTARVEN